MNKIIKFRVKKEIDRNSELKILKLKGNLITKGFTEIIHIADIDADYYLNFFTISSNNKKVAENFVLDYIEFNDLDNIIVLIS